jgi:hypothetical protein
MAVELILGMSPEAQATVPMLKWQTRALAAAERIARPGNIIGADVHYDEATPHLHVIFLPVVEMIRKQRGPLPKSGFRKQKKVPVLSYAAFAGHNSVETGKTISGWHDIYADHVKDLGLKRGVVGGRSKHVPQQRLYAQTAEIEAGGEKFLKLLEDPSALFSGLRRPTPEELSEDAKWATYLAYVSGSAKKGLAAAKADVPNLIELAKGGLFERRAREKIQHLEADRNQWQQQAGAAKQNLAKQSDAHAIEVRELACRLRDLETPPLKAREAAGMLGLPVFTRLARDRSPVDQVVTATGEALTLRDELFLKPDGTRQSVMRFLQQECDLKSMQEVFALLNATVGEAKSAATLKSMLRHMQSANAARTAGIALPTATARLLTLQANMETFLGVSQRATRRLFDEQLLTTDIHGRGVLLPRDHSHGYTFEVGAGGCAMISVPKDFTPLYLGDERTWTNVITEDPTLALRVYDATEGKISSTLVPGASINEERLNRLRQGHPEIYATPQCFTPDWDPSLSAQIRQPQVCLAHVTENMRSASHPIYTDAIGNNQTGTQPRMEWS